MTDSKDRRPIGIVGELTFAQYAVLKTIAPPLGPPPSSATGTPLPVEYNGDLEEKLVLVDEEDGQVIGELSDIVQYMRTKP